MRGLKYLTATLIAGASATALSSVAHADQFNIPGGDLATALGAYMSQTGVELVIADNAFNGARTAGVKGNLTADAALSRILQGTGFVSHHEGSAIAVVPARAPRHADSAEQSMQVTPLREASATAAGIESVVVTSSKIKGDIQTVPIAITALSQEQLTSRQIAGGPDLVKEVPNLTFSKTNFSGYTIQIRGIGTQAISVSTDPAVAVALNDIPFIRNHFFEQEFYDVNQVEVLRGPQGTLYGRNATAGVVNVISAKPTDQFEAMLSADIGNFHNRRYEGMVNIPVVDDWLDIRVAGEWTKRDGYTTNGVTGSQVDGRDLWSTRVTVGWKPLPSLQVTAVWEHFQESDDRMRTAKQLCKTDPGPSSILGVPVPRASGGLAGAFTISESYLSQGCLPTSMYSADAFEVPNGMSLPYVTAGQLTDAISGNPYASTVQSRNLRVIETQIDPRYDAKNNTVELNVDYAVAPSLTFTSQTGYNQDFLWSTEDYNRFNTAPGIFHPAANNSLRSSTLISPYADCGTNFTLLGNTGQTDPAPSDGTYYFGDPQLGCSNRLVVQDVSSEHAWQLSQEFRLASNFTGPFNFSVGGNYMHYETVENYYVFSNALTLFAAQSGVSNVTCPGGDTAWVPGVSDNHECLQHGVYTPPGFQYHDPLTGPGTPTQNSYYIDPNPLGHLNDEGHNYFVSKNPYVLDSYAGFGEAYYDVLSNLKLTGGIRWTDDKKHFIDIPSELLVVGYGYANTGVVDQGWQKLTGRLAANWAPKLDFTDQTLVYGSYAHGYKAGGANPPGAVLGAYDAAGGVSGIPIHPLTFQPEFVDAYEVGTKNTLLDGGLTLNGDVFFYNYKDYQISRIVDRTSINDNFDATVKGAEVEASYEPLPGLKFNFAGGYEDTRIKDGQSSIDLIDRTAGHEGWILMKPFPTESSNCVLPDYVVASLITKYPGGGQGSPAVSACGYAYNTHLDPVTQGFYHYNNGSPYYVTLAGGLVEPPGGPHIPYPVTIVQPGYSTITYPGFDPLAGTPDDPYAGQNIYNGFDYGPVPNNGEGFAKDLGGNELPNAPHFTVSFSGEYTLPVSENWAATLHSDFYWQSQSFARVFNDRPYDKIRGYSNVNLALILTSAEGWQVMGYLKNIFDTTTITGTFLNSDDSGLTTNVFLTDPRLFGVRVTKNW